MQNNNVDARITNAWQRIAPHAAREEAPTTPEQLTTSWDKCSQSVFELFAAQIGIEAATKRLVIPADYIAFMQRIGGGWSWTLGLDHCLFSADIVASVTTHEYRSFVTERDEDDAPPDDGLWLTISSYSDKHYGVLCCDTQHKLYGKLVDGHDDHPWLNGMSSPFCMVIADSFVEWLEYTGERLASIRSK